MKAFSKPKYLITGFWLVALVGILVINTGFNRFNSDKSRDDYYHPPSCENPGDCENGGHDPGYPQDAGDPAHCLGGKLKMFEYVSGPIHSKSLYDVSCFVKMGTNQGVQHVYQRVTYSEDNARDSEIACNPKTHPSAGCYIEDGWIVPCGCAVVAR